MRVVYMGTPDFSVGILKHLLDFEADKLIDVVGIVTRIDKPQGRRRILTPSPVKAYMQSIGHPAQLLETESVRKDVEALNALKPDLFIVASFGQILSQEVLSTARVGAINVHTSMLPLLRGAAPIARAIMIGMQESGVTIMEMVKALDAGDILAYATCPITLEDSAGSLEERLIDISRLPLMNVIIKATQEGTLQGEPQDEALVTWAPKIERGDLYICWSRSALEIHNHIRALTPRPGAIAHLQTRWATGASDESFIPLLVEKSQLMERGMEGAIQAYLQSLEDDTKTSLLKPGTLLEINKRIWVRTCEGYLSLGRVKSPGKRMIPFEDFVRGQRLSKQFLGEFSIDKSFINLNYIKGKFV